LFVELDAVDDDQILGRLFFGEEVDVFQSQIAVRVTRNAACSP
jgi:hypothetical protein